MAAQAVGTLRLHALFPSVACNIPIGMEADGLFARQREQVCGVDAGAVAARLRDVESPFQRPAPQYESGAVRELLTGYAARWVALRDRANPLPAIRVAV